MGNTPQVIALQEVKPKHYRYEWITAEYNLEGYDIIEQNLLNKEGRGDFNLPQINWSNYTSVMGLNDVGSINEECIVGDIKLESPLGKSDHACIYFHCGIQEMEDKKKADYLLMKQRLTMDWIQYLSLEPDIESKWNKFKRKFQAVIDEKLWAKVKKKQRLWERLKIMKTKFNERACTREMYLETEKEYRRLNNQVRWETRNILKCKEQEIAKNVKANPKVFWKYVQTKTRTKARIADLYKDGGKVQKTVNAQEKTDVLSEQFSRGYHMYTTIKKTTVEKDIGVVIDDKLTFSDHLAEKINKANKIMREVDTTRGNTKKIYKTRERLNLRRHSFPSRVVNNWNGLPEWVVNVETVEKFEAKLDKYWKNQQQGTNIRHTQPPSELESQA
ncbi:hypothetical protein Hamer_G024702, partial [Homarus americanus]